MEEGKEGRALRLGLAGWLVALTFSIARSDRNRSSRFLGSSRVAIFDCGPLHRLTPHGYTNGRRLDTPEVVDSRGVVACGRKQKGEEVP